MESKGPSLRRAWPFTFAHPAVVLPVRRRLAWCPMAVTALVCGSMAPDFEYFLRMHMHSTISHTFQGIWVFDLPMALLLSVVFEAWVRKPLVSSLPAGWARTPDEVPWPSDGRQWGIVVACALIGVLSHLGWDGFTHRTGFVVRALPWLETDVGLGRLGSWPVYRILQHASTVVGLVAMGCFWARRPRWCCRRISADGSR